MTTESQHSIEIVVGLPGSGKTTYLEKKLESGEIDAFYDDYQKGAPEDDKSNPEKSPNFRALSSDIEAGRRVALADIRYCVPEELDIIQAVVKQEWPELVIVTRFFENNIEACKHNVRLRARPDYVDAELQFIDEHSPEYKPLNGNVLPVIMG